MHIYIYIDICTYISFDSEGGFASAIPSPRGSLLGAVPTTRCKQRGRRFSRTD